MSTVLIEMLIAMFLTGAFLVGLLVGIWTPRRVNYISIQDAHDEGVMDPLDHEINRKLEELLEHIEISKKE